jgi:hypothetical protein
MMALHLSLPLEDWGGREVGGLANQLAAHMSFEPDDLSRVARFWGTEPHFPAAHGVWLSGQRKRAAARTVELPAGKVNVNDGGAAPSLTFTLPAGSSTVRAAARFR